MAEQEIRPVDVQVARPVQAPNYVGMYSESIKGALAPYEYLLNYQKELSEEDLRKAQIQNFLSEHDLKTKELSETIRSHTANEAMTALERQLNIRKEDEFERHNLVDEAHQNSQDQREADKEKEYERANKFNEEMAVKKQDLESSLNEANIAKSKADTSYLQSEADRNTSENELKENDQKVIQEFTAYKATIKPEDLYDSKDHPEIEQKIDEFADRIKTPGGRVQFDALHGEGTALGRELAERKELQKMSPDAKNVFQSNLLKSDTSKPYQVRFEEAMEAARPVNVQSQERAKWGPEGIKAETDAIASGKSKQEGFNAGRMAHEKAEAELKQKAAAEKPNEKILDWLNTNVPIPKNPGEDDPHYEQRKAQKALELEEKSRNDPAGYQKDLQELMHPAGTAVTPGVPATDWGKKYLGGTGGNMGMLSPDQQQKSGSALAQNTSPLLSSTTPTFAVASNANDLSQQFHDYFGTTEEKTPTEETA
jgi:hypothetical protein